MTTLHPHRLGLVILEHFADRNEALAGDILEGFQLTRSHLWFWRELLTAIITGAFWQTEIRPLKLVDNPTWQPPLEDYSAARTRLLTMGLGGTGIGGVGGLTVVAVVFGISALQPAFWILLMLGPILGLVIALFLVRRRRRHTIGDQSRLIRVVLMEHHGR